jgi:hypothetical protein
MNAYNNKHSLRCNKRCYGDKNHYTDSQNSYATAPSGRELYYLQFWLQAASPETFGYTLVCEGKKPLGSLRHRWEDSIKTYLKGIRYKDVNCINVAEDRDHWRASFNTVMKL